MTSPVITYGHGFMNDMNDASFWGAAHDSADPLSNVAIECQYGDFIRITGKADSVADEYVYYETTAMPVAGVTTDVYTKYFVRWKTSVASNGLGARVRANFTVGTQELLESTGVPQFSTTWHVTSGALTPGKTVSSLDIFADDYPDTLADSAAYYVYYDYILLCKDTFEFPNFQDMNVDPPSRYKRLTPLVNLNETTQHLGSDLTVVDVLCDLDVSNDNDDWKRPQGTTSKSDQIDGEVFLDILHNSNNEAFQLFSTGTEFFKVTLEKAEFHRSSSGSNASRTVELLLREYRPSSADCEPTYAERFGLSVEL